MDSIIYIKVLILGLLTIIPFIREKGFKIYNPAILISIIYFIEFGLSSLYMSLYPLDFWSVNFEPGFIDEGLNFVLVVYVFFLVGYYLPISNKQTQSFIFKILNKIPNPNNYNIEIKSLPMMIVGLLIVGWICRIILISVGVYYHVESGAVAAKIPGFKLYDQYLILGSYFPIVALIITFFEWLKNNSKKNYLNISLLFLFIELIHALPSGSKEKVLFPVFIILILYGLRAKIPLLPVLISSVLFLFFVFPLVTIYRLIYTGNILGDFQRAVFGYIDLISTLNKDALHSILFGVFGERFNYIDIVSRVVHYTPEIWDFKMGYTYFLFIVSLVPRILWRSKPEIASFGNEFGIDYGFITNYDFTTSIDMSWVGEMFINFGWYGVLAAFLYGVLYQTIYSYFLRSKRLTLLSVLLYLFSLYTMVRGGMFAGQFGGLVKQYIIFIILFLPFLKKVKTKQ